MTIEPYPGLDSITGNGPATLTQISMDEFLLDSPDPLGAPGETRLNAFMAEVSREVDKHTPEIAIGWYARALRQLGGDRFALYLALARACLNAGRHSECAQALRIADRMAADDDHPVRRAELALVRARMARLRGNRSGAIEVLNGALDEVVGSEPGLAARLQVERAAVAAPGGWPGIGRVWADSAVRVTVSGPDPMLHAHALAVQAMARLSSGDTAGGREAATACARMVDDLSLDDASRRPSTLLTLGWSELHLEEHDMAVRHLSRCLSLVDRWQWELAASARAGLGELCLRHGRYAEAAVHVERALWLARKSGAVETAASVLDLRCRLQSATLDTGCAIDELSKALLHLPTDNSVMLSARLTELEMRLAAGQVDMSEADFVEQCGGVNLPLLGAPCHPSAYAALARAALAKGDQRTALTWASRADKAAKWLGMAGRTAIAETAMAECATTPEERLRHAAGALAAAEQAGHLPAVAQAFTLIAREQMPHGVRGTAEALTRADDLATLMGARRMTRRINTLRAETERADSATPPQSPLLDGLTPREREVAVQVSRGRTNRQIARELGLSHKTVETHLSRIFNKFEVSSRAAVAARVGHDASSD